MGRTIITHIDNVPYRESWRGKWLEGVPEKGIGNQRLGDDENGPWILISRLPPGDAVPPHTHSQDQLIHVLEGELTVGDQACGPGTLAYFDKDTEYGFTAGSQGARIMIIRPGPATTTFTKK